MIGNSIKLMSKRFYLFYIGNVLDNYINVMILEWKVDNYINNVVVFSKMWNNIMLYWYN